MTKFIFNLQRFAATITDGQVTIPAGETFTLDNVNYTAGIRLGTFQETLDRVLGFHYEVRWFRPPFGNIVNEDGSYDAMRKLILAFGYEHVLLWDVSQTDPQLAIGKVRNGSVLLYHARHKDYACLEVLIPQLLEAGFEPVTVSELFGYPPPETGEELYVYNWEDYKDKVR